MPSGKKRKTQLKFLLINVRKEQVDKIDTKRKNKFFNLFFRF